MDYKEKVEWLGRYQASVSCQHMLEEEIEVLRSDAERVTACMSGMPGRSGPNADRLPRAVERIEEAQKRLEQQLESCMETRAEIMCGIMTVRDRPGQEVLRRRYVMGQNFSEIAEAMGVVQRRAYQLHRTEVWLPMETIEAGVKKISVNFPKISQNFIVFHNQQW